jgi:putative ubiquitin-RnfH superfamily antitoxin RatB of RatAB toxin-antitoxin module
MIVVEVVYAQPERQTVIQLQLQQGATVEEALRLSSMSKHHPDLDCAEVTVGIFGKPVLRDTVLQTKDRVEIYRPLLIDPKSARRGRARR